MNFGTANAALLSKRLARSIAQSSAAIPEGKASSGKSQCVGVQQGSCAKAQHTIKLMKRNVQASWIASWHHMHAELLRSLMLTGPTKLFLMLQCSCQSAMPVEFLPKREFQLKLRRGMHVRSVRPAKPKQHHHDVEHLRMQVTVHQ